MYGTVLIAKWLDLKREKIMCYFNLNIVFYFPPQILEQDGPSLYPYSLHILPEGQANARLCSSINPLKVIINNMCYLILYIVN